VAASYNHRATIVRDYGDVGPVLGVASELEQVFVNLVLNAAQAFERDDTHANMIRVSTRRHGDEVIIDVRDNGPGIHPRHIERVFDPFFTTKPVGMGTGLGLAICHGIVTGLDGKLSIDSMLASGTNVTVALRAGDSACALPPAPVPSPRPTPSRRLRVLLVDDEALMIRSLKRLLRPHDVVATTSGSDALRMCLESQFDVILCDLMMPDVGAMELVAELERERPWLARRVLVFTGGATTDAAKQFLIERADRVLYKTVDGTRLLEHIERVVASQPGAAA
jgi:CheY-like chemotaxis protein/anti-sigma regulatory factor (Ser/Thr protein kinase)